MGKLKMTNNFAKARANFQKVTGIDDFLPSLKTSSVNDMFLKV